MMSFEIVEEEHKIAEYQKFWQEILDSREFEILTSFEWTQALRTPSLLENDVFFLNYGISLTHVFPISELSNTYSDLLVNDSNENLIKRFIAALFSLSYKWDVFRMGRILETNPLLESIECHLKNASIGHEIKIEEPSFFLRLNNTYDDYLRKRSHNCRKYLKRVDNKIWDKGDIKLVKYEDYDNFNEAYKDLISIEKGRWKDKHGTAISSIEKQNRFYKELCENSGQKRWLHLSFLLLNNEPAAYNMGLVKNKN